MRNWMTAGGLTAALVACATVLGTSALLGFGANIWMLLTVSAGTLLVYQVDRVWLVSPEDRINAAERLAWVANRRGLLAVMAAAAAIGVVVGVWHLPTDARFLAAGLGVLGLVYSVPFRGRRLKGAALSKPWLIGAVWGIGSVVFPVVSVLGSSSVTLPVLLLAMYRGTIVSANVHLTDYSDRYGDASARLRTASVRWSGRTVRSVAALLSFGAAAALIAVGRFGYEVDSMLVLVEAAGPLALGFSALGHDRLPLLRDSLFLDALVAWPVLTYFVSVGF